MLTRTCLIVAIVAGVCTLALVHREVDGKIANLNARLALAGEKLDAADKEKAQMSEEVTKSSAALGEANHQRALIEQEKNALGEKLASAEKETKAAQSEAYRAAEAAKDLKKSNEELAADLSKSTSKLLAAQEENGFLSAEVKRLSPAAIVDTATMPNLKGTIRSVDPRWGFVVVDVGSEMGVLANGELKVSRDGRLIARLRIVKVEKDHCIANIIDGQKLTAVLEGDHAVN